MKSDFYICHKSIMPSFFEDVINAKKAVIEEKIVLFINTKILSLQLQKMMEIRLYWDYGY